MTSSVERTDLDFKISVALLQYVWENQAVCVDGQEVFLRGL